jgi:hypothetical protein
MIDVLWECTVSVGWAEMDMECDWVKLMRTKRSCTRQLHTSKPRRKTTIAKGYFHVTDDSKEMYQHDDELGPKKKKKGKET